MKIPSPQATAARLQRLSNLRPRLAIVTGTGLAGALKSIVADARISYAEIPGFAPPGVIGHPGQLILGRFGGEPVLVLAGRAHYYEGHAMSAITFAVRALAAFGIRDLLLTNAAGGIHPRFRPGDFMVVRDHINFMGVNPLRGASIHSVPGFVDLSRVYDPGLNRLLFKAAKTCQLKLHSGVYLAVCGPSYETPAEIRVFRQWGADAVGMSTVPEAVVACQCGLRVAALSCITNRAAGQKTARLSHQEVLETASRVETSAARMLQNFATIYRRFTQDSN